MNGPMWAAMREYVQAEVKLAVAELRYDNWPDANKAQFLEPLREQVTRMETAVREMIDKECIREGERFMSIRSALDRLDRPGPYGGLRP